MGKNPENLRLSASQKGFTLLEVLIALVILSVGLLGLASLTASVIRTNSFSDDFTTATALAQDKLENLVNLSFTDASLNDDISTNNNWGGSDPSMLSTSAGNFDTGNQENVDEDTTVNASGKYTRTWNIWDVSTTRKDIAVIVSWKSDLGLERSVNITTVKIN